MFGWFKRKDDIPAGWPEGWTVTVRENNGTFGRYAPDTVIVTGWRESDSVSCPAVPSVEAATETVRRTAWRMHQAPERVFQAIERARALGAPVNG